MRLQVWVGFSSAGGVAKAPAFTVSPEPGFGAEPQVNQLLRPHFKKLLVLAQNVAVQRGFLDPPAAADLNGRNLSALYERVNSRERNPQVLGRLFYGKEIVNWSFAHSLRNQ